LPKAAFLAPVKAATQIESFTVTLTYTFKVHNERFGGHESFPLTSEDDGERFESGCRERTLTVHYRQDNPDICVLDRDQMT
jgi:hypothetical protein